MAIDGEGDPAMAQFRVLLVLLAALCTAATACVSDQANAFNQQKETRLSKAAGVSRFRIVCVKDLWERTRAGEWPQGDLEGKATPTPDGLVTVELTGPQLVDYIERLAFKGFQQGRPSGDPLAVRMYNALGPVIDQIQPGAPPATVPEVRVDDPVASPSITATSSG
jgi:hypothetical protein